MNVVFIGASKFGLRCLELLLGMKDIIVTGVVTASEKFSISYRPEGVHNVLHADIQRFCQNCGVSCSLIKSGMKDNDLFEQVRSWHPDMFLVVGWYHMIPSSWRAIAPAYGLHASLLPDYSGGAPLVWAMINGEKQTGITLFQFADGVDNGPIVGQAKTQIREDDTIATLYARIEDLGLDLIKEYLPKLANGTAELQAQDESKRRIFPQRRPEDGMIDWNWSARDIYNFVRAQTRPYPGAFTTLKGKEIKIWNSRPARDEQEQAHSVGQVLSDTNSTLVHTGTGILEINEAKYEQKEISGAELKRIVGGGRSWAHRQAA